MSKPCHGRGWVRHQSRRRADRPPRKRAAAIWANEVELAGGAIKAVSALERANISFLRLRRKISITAFAVGSEFQGHVGFLAFINNKTQRRRATERQMQTRRATRLPLKRLR